MKKSSKDPPGFLMSVPGRTSHPLGNNVGVPDDRLLARLLLQVGLRVPGLSCLLLDRAPAFAWSRAMSSLLVYVAASLRLNKLVCLKYFSYNFLTLHYSRARYIETRLFHLV